MTLLLLLLLLSLLEILAAIITTQILILRDAKLADCRTRQIETLTKIVPLFENHVPDWIDVNNPKEVKAWQEARAEVLKYRP